MRAIVRITAALALVLLAAGAASADDVTSAIDQAKAAYSGGEYKEASTQLQTALAGVNQKLMDLIMDYLPDPPSGWTADEPQGLDASMLAVGVQIARDYHAPDGSEINLQIVANSPALAMVNAYLANPMMAQMTGQVGLKKVKACGYDALEEMSDDKAQISIVGGTSTLIVVEGRDGGDADHVRTLVGKINCKGIVEIVE